MKTQKLKVNARPYLPQSIGEFLRLDTAYSIFARKISESVCCANFNCCYEGCSSEPPVGGGGYMLNLGV